jgi:hypothetical protein
MRLIPSSRRVKSSAGAGLLGPVFPSGGATACQHVAVPLGARPVRRSSSTEPSTVPAPHWATLLLRAYSPTDQWARVGAAACTASWRLAVCRWVRVGGLVAPGAGCSGCWSGVMAGAGGQRLFLWGVTAQQFAAVLLSKHYAEGDDRMTNLYMGFVLVR